MSSIMSIGATGMRAAERRLEASASAIARSGVQSAEGQPETDFASELVAVAMAETDFKASAKLVEVGRNMMKTTLDMLA